MSGSSAPSGGLLAVHAHPDDETLSTGALLATWAGAGRPVTVVTCTRGERGEVIPADLAHLAGDGAALAAHREGELARALEALGVRDHLFLDEVAVPGAAPARFADSGMIWVGPGKAGEPSELPDDAFVTVGVDAAARRLARVIVDRRPEVVVGYEPGGGYGHPDHVHAHRVMELAVRLAADGPERFRVPAVIWAAQDVRELDAGCREVAPRAEPPLVPVEPDGAAPSLAVAGDLIDLRVEVAPVIDRLGAALRAHASQVQAVRTWDATTDGVAVGCFALSNGRLLPLLRTEGYRFAPGWLRGPVGWPPGVLVA
jgi:N-acetyl-1-D-myo-inositol-2-amino-2-deoxy-alpha-D-glucopyranoside deacetylase